MAGWLRIALQIVVCYTAFTLYKDYDKLRSFPIVATYLEQPRYSYDAIPTLDGKVAVVTGANTGVGYESVKAMAGAGAHVVMACRSMKKCVAAKEAITPLEARNRVETMFIDLAELGSVKTFAANLAKKHKAIDILMLNAGLATDHNVTADGFEVSFQVNHLSHFLLTHLLMPMLETSTHQPRVVVVSSDAHHYSYITGIRGQPDIDAINDPAWSSGFSNYGQSKLCNVLFVQELADRTRGRMFVNAAHPGLVQTEFISKWGSRSGGSYGQYIADNVFNPIMTALYMQFDAPTGALTQLYLATSPEIETKKLSGRYFVPVAVEQLPNRFAQNRTLQESLWTMSEALLNL